MLFTSILFLFFLPIVVAGYFILPHKWRWFWLLIASYAFYMYGSMHFVLILLGSTILDYYCAIYIERSDSIGKKRLFLNLSLLGNLGALFVFKYLGFFNDLLNDLAGLFSVDYPIDHFKLIFPIGISFYTFQSLSYTIDVFRGKREAEKHFGLVALYVSFFPQLVAGPIERSTTLMPQLRKEQRFQWPNTIDGLRLITWGIFKKIVIADMIGNYVGQVYSSPTSYHGFTHLLAAAAFVFQIYLDFSAYSDIAIGSAKFFGIDLNINFNRPLRALNIREFWQRWHITMTSWFFDYLYKPLGRKIKKFWQINILILMIIIGFWHGPTWGFIVFGALHGVYYIASDYLPRFEHASNKPLDILLRGMAVCGVFGLVTISAFFFRAESLNDALFSMTQAGKSLLNFDFSFADLHLKKVDGLIIAGNLLLFGIIQNLKNHDPKNPFSSIPKRWMRWTLYYYMIFTIISLAHVHMQEFIYFHF